MKKPQAIILVGPPGSGKSTSVKTLIAALPKGVVILSTDYYIQERSKVAEISFSEGIEIYMSDAVRHLNYMLNAAMTAKKSIIVDRTNMTRGARRGLIASFINNGYTVDAVEFAFDKDELFARNDERRKNNADIPVDVVEAMLMRYEPPSYDEGFANIYKMPYSRD